MHNETYGPGFGRVLADYGPSPDLMDEGDLLNIEAQLEEMVRLLFPD